MITQSTKVSAGLVDLFVTWFPVLLWELERTGMLSEETFDRMGLPRDGVEMCNSAMAPRRWRACAITSEALERSGA